MPEHANAQIWVSSGFQAAPPGPGGQLNETATCTTSADDPVTGLPTVAATDYNLFYASCAVTPSTGAVITSPQCPGGARGLASGSSSSGNPTGQCSITFQPQPGVTYTLNSIHGFYFMPDLPGTVCGPQLPGLYQFCFSDPLGYFSFNLTAYQNGIYPWAPTPPFDSTNASNTNNEVTCKADGGVCSAQNFPNQYCQSGDLLFGTPVCTGPIKIPQVWKLATSSAVYNPCPPPTGISVSPRTWIAGKTFPITITGTGFNSTATPTCSATTVTWAGGNVRAGPVTISNVTVVSPTQITASVTPGPNAPTQPLIALIVKGTSNGVSNAVNNSSGMLVQILGTPVITWTSDPDLTTPTISGPNATLPNPSAVLGQQIVLTTDTPAATAYDGAPVSELWTVGGTNVAGWAPTTASGPPPTPTVLNTTGLTTYWVSTQGAGPLTYQYCVNIQGANPVLQCTLNATANFAVSGPTNVTVFTCGGSLTTTGCTQTGPLGTVVVNPGPCLQFGGTPSNTGIIFTANATPPSGYSNTFVWGQLITNDQTIESIGTATETCLPATQPPGSTGTGFDGSYPIYQGNLPFLPNDSPKSSLSNILTELSRSFSATTYLMWTPGLKNAIPVPLGSVSWGFSGDASLTNAQTNQWSVNSGSGSAGAFQPSTTYPQWSDWVDYSAPPVCQ